MLSRELLQKIDKRDVVHDRATLLPYVPELLKLGPEVWIEAFNHFHTRFNKFLFLNAPELWGQFRAQDWLELMNPQRLRSYEASDVYTTGRFDDLRFLGRYLGVDFSRFYFEHSTESLENKKHVKNNLLHHKDFYQPDEEFDEDEVYVKKDFLLECKKKVLEGIS